MRASLVHHAERQQVEAGEPTDEAEDEEEEDEEVEEQGPQPLTIRDIPTHDSKGRKLNRHQRRARLSKARRDARG